MTRPYRVVIAPDKFKGSLSAEEVAETIAEVLARCPRVEVVKHPFADGGEGTVDLALAAGFDPVAVNVTGRSDGQSQQSSPRAARWPSPRWRPRPV